MGQKVHPIGFRLGVKVGDRSVKNWQGLWYAKKNYRELLQEDLRVRRRIMDGQADAGVSKVEIERSANQMTVTIHAAKPGIVIGKGGVKVEELRRELEATTAKKVRVTIAEIRQPETDAYLLARNVCEQLVRRVAFRRAMKQAVSRALRFGAKGVKVQVAGRLGGSEMSRTQWERDGRVPLHTLRADIDFGQAEAHTTYGVIGTKVWIYRGDVIHEREADLAALLPTRSQLAVPLAVQPEAAASPASEEAEAAASPASEELAPAVLAFESPETEPEESVRAESPPPDAPPAVDGQQET